MVVALVVILVLVVLLFISMQRNRVKQMAQRDTQRLADITTFSNALDEYFEQNAAYPQSLVQLVPDYLLEIPAAPLPADGDCASQTNGYAYQPTEDQKTFGLAFCLGRPSGGYQSGELVLTPAGISTFESSESFTSNK